jgi:hypothetical protein
VSHCGAVAANRRSAFANRSTAARVFADAIARADPSRFYLKSRFVGPPRQSGKPISVIINQSGDVLWYLALIFNKLGVALEQVAKGNIRSSKPAIPINSPTN